MAQKLGVLFSNAALGAVSFAGTCIMARKVKEGLAELTAANLLGGVDRGIDAVASATGLPRAYVASMLPMDRITLLGQHIAEHQTAAAMQWDVHTGHIGGLLEGVADLTDDGRAPNTALCLQRLAKKMRLDKALALPLKNLADDLQRWDKLMTACRDVIDDGASLRNAYGQKRMLRIGVLVAVALALSAVGIWVTRLQLARGRVDARLSLSDPCEVEGIDDADLAKASDEQTTNAKQLGVECKAARKEQRRLAEERRRQEERQRLEEERQRARAAECDKLASAVEKGSVPKLDVVGKHSQLLARIARGKLTPPDITGEHGKLPCADTPALERISGMYARAALVRTGDWMFDHKMSTSSARLVVLGQKALGIKMKSIFTASVDRMATDAVNMGDTDKIDKVKVLCKLVADIGEPERQMCKAAREVPD